MAPRLLFADNGGLLEQSLFFTFFLVNKVSESEQVCVCTHIHTYAYTRSMVFNEQVQGRKDRGNSLYKQLFPCKISANIPLEHAL